MFSDTKFLNCYLNIRSDQMLLRLMLLVTLCVSSLCSVAGTGTGKIQNVKVIPDLKLLAVRITNYTGAPACATWHHHLVIKFNNDDAINALYSLLLSAKTSGQTVRIVGSGACVAGTSAELIVDADLM